MSLSRFGVSLESKLLNDFDELIKESGYPNRSEAIRDLIRDRLVQREWEVGEKEIVGTISLVYDHKRRELPNNLTEIQHEFVGVIIASMHVHLDKHNCLEVLIVKGNPGQIKKIADNLIGTKGVKHGKLTMTTVGRDLA